MLRPLNWEQNMVLIFGFGVEFVGWSGGSGGENRMLEAVRGGVERWDQSTLTGVEGCSI